MRYWLFACLVTTVLPLAATEEQPVSTRLLWGDTHLHTSNSFDVYLFGTIGSTPDTAYRFARGLPVVSPTTGVRRQLETPLDFLVVSDHAELIGSIPRLYAGDREISDTVSGRALLAVSSDRTEKQLQYVYNQIALLGSGLPAEIDLTAQQVLEDLHAGEKRRTTWDETIEAAERHNEPGVFSALIGWEWSAQPRGGNLHRVVFMSQGAEVGRQFLPYSALESVDPRDLWDWLDRTSRLTGADFVAIPHNPNLSMGLFFPTSTLTGLSLIHI